MGIGLLVVCVLNKIDFMICATSQPMVAAASFAVRVLAESSITVRCKTFLSKRFLYALRTFAES